MSLLLIVPPFAIPRTPHMALPVLAGYLRSRHIDVSALDANIEFFHHFITHKNIEEGRRFAREKFRELNTKKKLTPLEEEQYLRLAIMLSWPEDLKNEEIIFEKKDSLGRLLFAFHAAMFTASAPYFPESVEIQPISSFIEYRSKTNRFSSHELVHGVEKRSVLTGFFEKIIPPLLHKTKPLIVGFSVSFSDQIEAALRCARVIRQYRPEAHITMGGSFISAAMSRTSERHLFRIIDSLIMEDGELPLENLVKELSSPLPDLSAVPGLVYDDGKQIRRNPVAPPLELESMPAPDYTIFKLDRYLMPKKIMGLPFRSSRGCPWRRCAFCRTDAPAICHHQQPSADYLYETMLSGLEKTGVELFNFTDDASSPETLEAFSRLLIGRKRHVHWTTSFRLDRSVTLQRCRLFSQAGCTNIHFGLETYNDRLLRLANKGTTVRNINFVISNAAWAGIYTLAYMMVGFPTETEYEARQTFAGIQSLKRQGILEKYMYHSLQILPGSQYFQEPEKYGISNIVIPEGQDLDSGIHDYKVSGMPRKTARRLASEFNLGGNIPEFADEVTIDDATVSLKHNLSRIFTENIMASV